MADCDAQVAEWFGKLLAVRKSTEAGVPNVLLLADCTGAAVNEGVTRSTGSRVLDCCVRYVISAVRKFGYAEGYVQAQHDSKRDTSVAQAQALAHERAQTPSIPLEGAALPFISQLSLHAVMLREGRVCLRPTRVLTEIYKAEVLEGQPRFLKRYSRQTEDVWSDLVH